MALGFGDPAIDDLSASLKAYWALEETGSANRIDQIGSNDLVPTNTPGTRSGKLNNACDFIPGSNQFLSIGDNADLSPVTDVAFVPWVWFDDVSDHRSVFNKRDSYGLSYFNNVDRLTFFVEQSDSSVIELKTGVTPSTGSWLQIICIADSTAGLLYLYLDGVSQGTPIAYDGTIKDDTDTVYMSSWLGASQFHDGGVDELPFYKDPTFADAAARNAFVAAYWNGGAGRFLHELLVPQIIMI